MPEPAVAVRHFVPLAIAVFTSGAVLLGLEIAASRVVAPYFGNSLFVWGALIGVVLAGLAVGYWLGGVVADRVPHPRLLTTTMAIGALLVLLVPLIDGPVLDAVVRWDPGPRLNPLIAAILLFGLPSIVFASVSPIGVRLVARSVATVGRTSGRLFAISTAGSIAGTFATAFILIPEFGTNQLLGQCAAVLFAAVAIFAAAERLTLVAGLAVVACVGATIVSFALAPVQSGRLAGTAAQNYSPVYRLRGDAVGADLDYKSAGFDVVYRKDTQYHGLAVVDDETSRYLRFDSSFQSGMYKDDPYRTRFEYSDYLQLALAYKPDAKDVLFIGLGGGSAQKRMWRDFKDIHIDVAEIDPVVRDVAYRYFALPRSPRLDVEAMDGRRYLDRADKKWDAIIVDAYYADSIPFHLSTLEFQELVRSHLKPGGGRRREHHRLARGAAVTSVPLVRPHVQRGVSDGRGASRHDARRHEPADAPQHHRRRRGGRRAERGLPPPALERACVARGRLRRRTSKNAIQFRRGATAAGGGRPVLTDDYAPTDALLVVG